MRRPDAKEQVAARDQVLAAARAFLADEQDVLHTAERIAGYVWQLDPNYEDPDLRVFVGVHSETDKYLVQDSVNGWHPAVRASREAEYRAANELYRDRVQRAASALVVKLAAPA